MVPIGDGDLNDDEASSHSSGGAGDGVLSAASSLDDDDPRQQHAFHGHSGEKRPATDSLSSPHHVVHRPKKARTSFLERGENYRRPPVVITYEGMEIDVTKKHPNASDDLTVPSADKKAFYWNFFHIGSKFTEVKDPMGRTVTKEVPTAICNLCCQMIGIAKRNYRSLEKHLCSSIYRDFCYYAVDLFQAKSTLKELKQKKAQEACILPQGTNKPMLRRKVMHETKKPNPVRLMTTTTTTTTTTEEKPEAEPGVSYTEKATRATTTTTTTTVSPEEAKEKADLPLAALDAHVKFWASAFTPLLHLDSRAFQELLQVVAQCGRIGVEYSFPQDKIQHRCKALAQKGREELKRQQLQDQSLLHFTVDHWTNHRGKVFASLTTQFIDDRFFVLRNLVLAVHHYDSSTPPDERIAMDFRHQLMDSWKLTAVEDKKTAFLVTDTAVNFGKSGISSQANTDDWTAHVYGLDHILQRIAMIAFKLQAGDRQLGTVHDMGLLDDDDNDENTSNTNISVIRKVQRLISFFRGSVEAKESLGQIASSALEGHVDNNIAMLFSATQSANIPQWWFILAKVEKFLKTKDYLTKFFYVTEETTLRKWAGKTKNGLKKSVPELPTTEEWNALEQLSLLLSPLKDAQKTLSSKKYVTSSLVIPYLLSISKNLQNLCERGAHNMTNSVKLLAQEMKNEFNNSLGDIDNQIMTHGDDEIMTGAPTTTTTNNHDNPRRIALHPSFYKAYALDPRTKAMKLLQPPVQRKIWDLLLEEMIQMGPISPEEGNTSRGTAGMNNNMAATTTPPASEKSPGETNVEVASAPFPQQNNNTTDSMEEFEIGDSVAQLLGDDENDEAATAATDQNDRESFSSQCQLELEKFETLDGLKMYFTRGNKKIVHDPLQTWWKAKSNDFPNLWRLARKYLALPATASSPDRASSIVRLAMDEENRGGLTLSTISDLHFLRENWGSVEEE